MAWSIMPDTHLYERRARLFPDPFRAFFEELRD